MEKTKIREIESDLRLYYIQATSSSDIAVLSAFQKLWFIAEGTLKRKTYGIFRPENGKIVYLACAEETVKDEFQKHGLPFIILPKGKYKGIEIQNHSKNSGKISPAFIELLKDPDIDKDSFGYCVEEYGWEDEVFCMMRTRG